MLLKGHVLNLSVLRISFFQDTPNRGCESHFQRVSNITIIFLLLPFNRSSVERLLRLAIHANSPNMWRDSTEVERSLRNLATFTGPEFESRLGLENGELGIRDISQSAVSNSQISLSFEFDLLQPVTAIGCIKKKYYSSTLLAKVFLGRKISSKIKTCLLQR